MSKTYLTVEQVSQLLDWPAHLLRTGKLPAGLVEERTEGGHRKYDLESVLAVRERMARNRILQEMAQ